MEEFNKNSQVKDGRRPDCKECERKRSAEYYEKNSESIKQKSAKYYEDNKEAKLEYQKEYAAKNAESIAEYKRSDKVKETAKIYRANHKEEEYARNAKYKREQMQNNPVFRFKENTRTLIRNSMTKKYGTKRGKTIEILGCTLDDFNKYIESQFDSNMTWENYGSYWEIDHIKPLALAKTIEEVITLNHFTNLQPLEKKANREKWDYWEGKRASV